MATLRKSRGGCDWLAGWVGSYHIRGFEGVPLATDAARDTETKTRVLLYSHTQLEKEKEDKTKQTEKNKRRTSESEMHRSEQSLREHREDRVYTWKPCFHVSWDTFWQLCWRSAVQNQWQNNRIMSAVAHRCQDFCALQATRSFMQHYILITTIPKEQRSPQ